MTGSNGLQLYLLSEYLDKISNRLNTILEPFIQKSISLTLDKDNVIMNISSNDKQIYTLSGMESFMLDISFIIIINEISQKPKSNIMFIDESISVLDKNRLENINELLLFLKQYFNQVFMITHMKQVKNQIDYYLEINKFDKYSLINNSENVIIFNLKEEKEQKEDNNEIINTVRKVKQTKQTKQIIQNQAIDV
jgi:DNA repair exonuclease SbcCD ATPase subunit